jgi:hypothetical protein
MRLEGKWKEIGSGTAESQAKTVSTKDGQGSRANDHDTKQTNIPEPT